MSVSYGGDSITFADGSIVASGSAGFKNKIINGHMMIDQRYAGAATANTINDYTLDRWTVQQGNSHYGKLVAQQVQSANSSASNYESGSAPAGFVNSLKITSQSAYTLVSGDYYCIQHKIEGNNVADLNWGTANAVNITLSFWTKSSLTGSFSVVVSNNSENYCYPITYTINSANTWEYKTITIPAPTSGTWLKDNGLGVRIYFGLGAASYTSAPGSWTATQTIQATGTTSVVSTSGATFYLTGVQFEKSSTASSFEFRSIQKELMLCQRYYFKISGTSGAGIMTIAGNGTASAGNILWFPVAMRSSPTWSSSGLTLYGYTSGSIGSFDSFYTYIVSSFSARLIWNGSGITSGAVLGDVNCSNSSAYAAFSAEL